MRITDFKRNFSMPLRGEMYGPPPYLFRGVEDLFIRYTANTDAVVELLPPHIEPADDPVICTAWCRWIPFSSFGPYHEAYVMVDVNLHGEKYLYQPLILVDNEIPLGAGREIWGYPKKMASIEHHWGDYRLANNEQFVVYVERPSGLRLMTASMICDRAASAEELPDFPILSYRHIPAAETAERPSVSEIVRLDVSATLHTNADGSQALYTGRSALEMRGNAGDPWHLLAPEKIINGYFAIFDFDLNFGKVVHNYLDDPDVWG